MSEQGVIMGHMWPQSSQKAFFPAALAAVHASVPRCEDTGPHQAAMGITLASKRHAPQESACPVINARESLRGSLRRDRPATRVSTIGEAQNIVSSSGVHGLFVVPFVQKKCTNHSYSYGKQHCLVTYWALYQQRGARVN